VRECKSLGGVGGVGGAGARYCDVKYKVCVND
jgi:hypothetical protein